MNRLIVLIGLIVYASCNAQGQGMFEFMNVGVTDDRQIFIGEYLTGPKATGAGYQIAIFWGPLGTTDESLLVQVGDPTGFLDAPGEGYFNGGPRTIFGLSPPGSDVVLQARAWDASTGATWDEAAANPAGRIGKGPIFQMGTTDPTTMDPLPQVGYASGWQGFAIAVPEPSVWGLAAMGVAALLILRRRR